MHYRQFSSRKELVDQMTRDIVDRLNDAIAKRGHALMAVSGGNSPKPLFEQLSTQNIDWAKVTITLVDERWVDDQHPDSNAKLVREHLLQNQAVKAQFVPLYNGARTPFIAERDVNSSLAKLNLPFDVIILGMGEDGHTASFFSSAPTLKDAIDIDNDRLCCAIDPQTAPHQRLTLTLAPLLASQAIYLLVTGQTKLPVLRKAMETFAGGAEQSNWLAELPVRCVLHQAKPVAIYYAD